jgi:penicillin-binding protein 2
MKRTPNQTQESTRKITRRAVFASGVALGVGGVLAHRMRYLQVERADDYLLLAEENRISDRLLLPERGLIFDRRGVLLAGNEQTYRVTLTPEDADDPNHVLDRLADLVNLDMRALDGVREDVEDTIRAGRGWTAVPVADGLSWAEISAIAVNSTALPGVTPEASMARIYPMGADFTHIVGYVRSVRRDYAETNNDPDPLLRQPGFQVGDLNIEDGMESALRGTAGTRRVEVNAHGRVMRELDRTPARAGSDVQLTADAGLQNYVEARLGNQSAGAVVIDCTNGEILSLASAPTYDPTPFARTLSPTTYRALLNNPYRPLVNKATQGLYPPGSTYKMIVALAALEAGLIDPEEEITCGGSLELGDRIFHCWRRGGHGPMNLVQALSESCDTYFYDLAQRIGIEAMTDMATRLGCGVRHDLPLTSVARGVAPTMEWKQRSIGSPWVMGDTLNASIGQGFVLTSPLQLAVMTARLATGRAITPKIVKAVNGINQISSQAPDLGVAQRHLDVIRQGMWQANNDRRGTAYSSRVLSDDHVIAGKTGTSQVRNITFEERQTGVLRNDDLPWEQRDHALYVGYGPADNPRYAVSVLVEHGGGGSVAAAPIGRDILLRAQLGAVPSPDLYPISQRREIEALHNSLPLLPSEPVPFDQIQSSRNRT